MSTVGIPSSSLQMQQKQGMNLTQRLMMSTHMQQAIHLLQLPILELEPFIEEQVVANPLLDIIPIEKEGAFIEERTSASEKMEKEITIDDRDLAILNRLDEDYREHFAGSEATPMKRSSEEEKLKSYLENSICADPSLLEKLHQQAIDTFNNQQELAIADILIGYIDTNGFLKTPLQEICLLHTLDESAVKDVLREMQEFEPYGIAAASIQESLLIQLRCLHKEGKLAYRIIKDYYNELLHNHIPLIQKQLKCSFSEIQEAIEKDIAKLDLHPGTHFSAQTSQVLIPDVTLRQEGEKLIVDVDRDRAPTLKINRKYLRLLNDTSTSSETKQFIKRHLFSARWLVRNLQQRYSTIERIAEFLAANQYEFFTQPDGQLKPLTMKTIADALELHESTIARTVSNKYINSPKGIFSLRSFFTTKYTSEEGEDLSAKTVKEAILEIISGENKLRPFSDEKISEFLKSKGITCARRTVAKYRQALDLGNTQQRKKFHQS
ncbi:RNA polymerase sigma-54 factor [Candidatus Protochlamydia amoebophila]|uniref:RNA polymerase factor sigma-54 n=1 Tax=Candidatus Protochlamydia amoebophila TaxID=362787 RepID=UPI001BC8F921|nr:RNA polymerase factor sigma-54 [Candidatus Protochlamydia amoebophila]MBS4164720.1 RNA polymerase sigma-54 factor [Candidatus Protochlamydia amoebophila]